MEWREAWLAAERSEADAAAQEAMDAADAWQPAAQSWASMDLDGIPAGAAAPG